MNTLYWFFEDKRGIPIEERLIFDKKWVLRKTSKTLQFPWHVHCISYVMIM